MFLRRCERRQRGKKHTYWALVESYRTGRGSRQRFVAYLGDLKPRLFAFMGIRKSQVLNASPAVLDKLIATG